MDAKNGKCTVRDGGRPRRLRMRSASRSAPAASVRRKGAGDGMAASTVDRHKTAKTENYFPAPDWLYTILSEDDDVYQEICGQDHDPYSDYEYEDRY